MSMNLDELKQAWTHMELRQDGMEALLRADFRERRIDKTRSVLRRSIAVRVVELLVWVAFTGWVASFWFDYRQILHWLVIGLILHAYGIAAIWASATQLLLLTRIHLFDAPVLVMQRRLAQLRRFRVWCTFSLGLPWWCLWLLVPMVAVQWYGGIDWFVTSPAWIWISMMVGIVGMAASVWLAHILARGPVRAAWLQSIIDDMSGCNLRRATRELEELARFERD